MKKDKFPKIRSKKVVKSKKEVILRYFEAYKATF